MKLDSVRSFKAKVSAEVRASATFEGASSFYESTLDPMPAQMALGVALRDDGEHVLAIRTVNREAAEAMAARVHGEADIRILEVTPRPAPGDFQKRVRPLESGLQIGMANRNFVGTLAGFCWDEDGNLCGFTNAHVAADSGRAQPGHPIGQPFGTNPADRIGTLLRWALPGLAPGIADIAAFRLDNTQASAGYSPVLGQGIRGVRELTAADLGIELLKDGRTTGSSLGRLTAVEVDGLGVRYDQGVKYFNDQHEISGGPTADFSAGGDSGSLIVTRDGYAVALLFAGGHDGTEDRTYANNLPRALASIGVRLAI